MSRTVPAPVLASTPRTTLRRRAERGSYELSLIHAILDEALTCHVAVNVDGEPRIVPTAHVRVDDTVYVHGARQNRVLAALAGGSPCCLSVTLLDGLVFSRSAFHHSMNYRSVVLYGRAAEVTGEAEKQRALRALVEHVAEGRYAEARPPSAAQLRSTLLVALPIAEGSAKVRSGPPLDDASLLADDCWAGELPLKLVAGAPRPDPELAPGRAFDGAVPARARSLWASATVPWERRLGELLLSTDPGRVDRELVHRFLSQESYWASGVSRDAVERSLENSLVFGLYREREQLAFARVVSDLSRFAYLADVFVVAAERGRGLGKLLLGQVFDHPDLCAVERWHLGTRDAHSLYERYGFRPAEPGRMMARVRA